ncbi:MAG: adenylate/guanylate cyclase domain-containing protein [Gammaproteobacteria bacterium]
MSGASAARPKVVLSADVVGSTSLYDTLGDAEARQLIADALERLAAICARHRGDIVAEVGDQLVVVFDEASAASAAASEVHESLHHRAAPSGRALRMRVGLHCGELPPGAEGLASTAVKIANWASSNAKPEQTLATRAVIDALPRIFRAVSRYVDDETWNALSIEHVELYEIIWDVESITAYAGEQPALRETQGYRAVTFTYGDLSLTVDADRPVASIGRAEHNDLVIRRDLVSRQHLSVQFSRGRCTITDNSTNGSLVVASDGTRYPIKRESLRLHGSGVIIPGQPPAAAEGFEIRFRCE